VSALNVITLVLTLPFALFLLTVFALLLAELATAPVCIAWLAWERWMGRP
jgi:hypothetical protein